MFSQNNTTIISYINPVHRILSRYNTTISDKDIETFIETNHLSVPCFVTRNGMRFDDAIALLQLGCQYVDNCFVFSQTTMWYADLQKGNTTVRQSEDCTFLMNLLRDRLIQVDVNDRIFLLRHTPCPFFTTTDYFYILDML